MAKENIVRADLFLADTDFSRFAWQPFRDGVEIFPIYQQTGGASAALLRYQPGARVPRHRHPAPEHILVLRGSQRDASGIYATGTLVVNLPDSEHAVASDDGCVVLAIWVAPVQFI